MPSPMPTTTWLVTGGAGYIGAHVTHALRAAGLAVVVLDDLSTGVPSRLPPEVPLIKASVLDTERLRSALLEYRVVGVVHLAGKKAVAESVAQPLVYWRENVGGVESILHAMNGAGVDRIVFSSSAAVYGIPSTERVTEITPAEPISPYGRTKLAGEWLLRDHARSAPVRWAALRYFNVAGAGTPALGDTGATNLIPLVLQAHLRGEPVEVFGGDYPTRDGTCVRDYIDVCDLAEAHVAAVHALGAGSFGQVLNLGRGEGVTVREVLQAASRVVGHEIAHVTSARRPGDPPACYADPAKAGLFLGWRATRTLEDMVSSAWEARKGSRSCRRGALGIRESSRHPRLSGVGRSPT